MRKVATIGLGLFLMPVLTGCAEMAEHFRAKHQAHLVSRCADFGVQQADPRFANCAMKVEQMDAQNSAIQAANSAALMNASIQLMNASGPSSLPPGAYRLGSPMATCHTRPDLITCF